MKKYIKRFITNYKPLLKMLNGLVGDAPRVFFWHRFTPPMEVKYGQVSADVFGWQLDQIQENFQVLTLGETLKYHLEHHQWPRRCVVLTIDDGYRDFYQWAFPELKKRGLQATFFVTVNFVAGKIWLWPDRLRWALEKSTVREVALPFHDDLRRFTLKDLNGKLVAWKSFNDHCTTLADNQKEMFIKAVEEATHVSCPEFPTEEFCAATWDELREMIENGIEIGSHTMNHPILSKIERNRLEEEIRVSREVLEDNLKINIISFCYPNGQVADINNYVIKAVKETGYLGAVMCTNFKKWHPFTISRIGVNSDYTDFLWKLYGGECL